MAPLATLDRRQRIAACQTCGGARLPLLVPQPDDKLSSWACAGCHQLVDGTLDPKYEPDELRNLQPMGILFDRSKIQPISAAVGEINLPSSEHLQSVEKRSAKRHLVTCQVIAQQMDKMLETVGEPFCAMTRDISTKGIGLFYDRAIGAPYLAVEIKSAKGEYVQLLVRVIRRRPRGRLFDIAGEFLTKLAPPAVPIALAEPKLLESGPPGKSASPAAAPPDSTVPLDSPGQQTAGPSQSAAS